MVAMLLRSYVVGAIILSNVCSLMAMRTKSAKTLKGGKGGKGGKLHEVMLVGTEVTQYDDKNGFTYYYRGNYLKHERCNGATCEECDVTAKTGLDCVKPIDEWGDYIDLDVSKNSQWTTFKTSFELKCPDRSENLKYEIEVDSKYKDSWKVYQNGKRLQGTSKSYKVVKWDIDLSGSHGNIVSLEFHVPRNAPVWSNYKAGKMAIWMDFTTAADYLQCEDSKVCLSTLSVSRRRTSAATSSADLIKASRSFRYSNGLQKDCLEGSPMVGNFNGVCNTWKQCLDAQTEKEILLLLKAGHAGDSSHGCGKNVPGCIDPLTSDPEGWECNCMEEWQAKCKAINEEDDEDCVKAAFCNSDAVCQCWKNGACKDSNVQRIQKKLQAASLVQITQAENASASSGSLMETQQQALMHRALDGATEEALDAATGSKACI